MSAPTAALDYMSSITQKRIIPYMVDQVTQTNTTWNMACKNAIFMDGGDYISQPVLTSIPTSKAVPFSGTDSIPSNFQENEQGAVFDFKHYAIRIDLPDTDLDRNDGVAAAMNLVRLRCHEAEIALRDRLGGDLQADGSGYDAGYPGKAIVGFAAAIDNGGTVDTYGGISRASYTVWKAYVNANGAVNRALSVDLIDTGYQNTSWDADCPNMNVTTPGLLTKFCQLIAPIQRINTAEVGVAGYKQVFYRGYPVVSDMQIQTTPDEFWYGLNLRYHQLYIKRGKFFKFTGWQRPVGQVTISAMILLTVCYIVSRPASQFKLEDLDSTL